MLMILVAMLIVLVHWIVKIGNESLSCYWLTPRRIKKRMEKQGVRGPKPRFLVGNILDMASFCAHSTSKDMDSITHDIVARLLPHFVAWSKLYGKLYIYIIMYVCILLLMMLICVFLD